MNFNADNWTVTGTVQEVSPVDLGNIISLPTVKAGLSAGTMYFIAGLTLFILAVVYKPFKFMR